MPKVDIARSCNLREPKSWSEFEIQARLWFELRGIGVNLRGEVSASVGEEHFQKVRFDLVEFLNGRPILVIEVKKKLRPRDKWRNLKKREQQAIRAEKRQLRKYRELDVPVLIIRGMEEAEKYIEERRKLHAAR